MICVFGDGVRFRDGIGDAPKFLALESAHNALDDADLGVVKYVLRAQARAIVKVDILSPAPPWYAYPAFDFNMAPMCIFLIAIIITERKAVVIELVMHKESS